MDAAGKIGGSGLRRFGYYKRKFRSHDRSCTESHWDCNMGNGVKRSKAVGGKTGSLVQES